MHFPHLDILFGEYFYEDWPEDYQTDRGTVSAFKREEPASVAQAAADIEQLLRLYGADEAALAHVVHEELRCRYWPPGVGKSYGQWLREIQHYLLSDSDSNPAG